MQRDYIRLAAIELKKLPVTMSYVPMGRAMEAVTPNAVPPIKRIRDRVEESVLRKRLVKSCIEYGNLRHTLPKQILSCSDALYAAGYEVAPDRCNFPRSKLLRKFLLIGKNVEIAGQQGLLKAVTATHVILESQGKETAISNETLLHQFTKQ